MEVTLTLEIPASSREELQRIIDTVTTYDLIDMATCISDTIEPEEPEPSDAAQEPTVFMCQNCGTLYTEDELDPLDDVSERVAPGETMPWGQCPDEACAAVCYPPENMTPEEIAQQLKEQAEETAECSDCDAPVTRDDPYFATPCGTFCEPCMREKHAPGCGICASEFDLETEEDNA